MDLMDHVYTRHTLHRVAIAGDHVLQSLYGVVQEKVTDLIRWIREQDVDNGSTRTSLRAVQWNTQLECWTGHCRGIGFCENLNLRWT